MHESLGFSVWFGKLSYLENDKKYMLSYHVIQKINHICCCVHNFYIQCKIASAATFKIET